MTASAYTAVGVVVAGCIVYAWDALGGWQLTRAAVLRARWAWRCRPRWRYRGRPPVPKRGEDRLTRDELQALGNLEAGRDVRART